MTILYFNKVNFVFILGGMDNITNIRISNQTAESVVISWDEPLNPNGQILTYQLKYGLVDKKDVRDSFIITTILLYGSLF